MQNPESEILIDVSKTNDVQENEIIYPQPNSIKSKEILVEDIKGLNEQNE